MFFKIQCLRTLGSYKMTNNLITYYKKREETGHNNNQINLKTNSNCVNIWGFMYMLNFWKYALKF